MEKTTTIEIGGDIAKANREIFDDVNVIGNDGEIHKLDVTLFMGSNLISDRKDIKTAMADAEKYMDIHGTTGMWIVLNTIFRDYVMVKRSDLQTIQGGARYENKNPNPF
jgi:hypothetical protein